MRPAAAPVALGHLLHRFGKAGHGVVLLVLSPLAALPIPFSSVPAGIGILVVGIRMLLGRERAWLPAPLRRVRITRQHVLAALRRLARFLRFLGVHPRPRLAPLVSPAGRRVVGLSVTCAGVAVLLPVPFGNQLPALAMATLGIGLVRRDGAALLIGHALVLASVAWVTTLVAIGHRFATWGAALFWG